MAYVAPFIDETGLNIPTYEDIKQDLIDKTKTIYGNDIYLEYDSQDYQMISAFSLMLYDTMQSLMLAYNNASPSSAVSTGLDRLVQLNGITRRSPTKSICVVTITGQAGTVISNGVVQDINNINWLLPEYIVIGESGSINTNAECELFGSIQVPIGGISKIVTSVPGWSSVSNSELATVGLDSETDSQLRARQVYSSSLVARSLMDSIIAAIYNLDAVEKVVGYENDTSEIVGVYPPHSITLVVKGGEDTEIANEIYWRKTLGTATHGNVSVSITSEYGGENIIKFQRPIEVPAIVTITIVPLASYNSIIIDDIKSAIAMYINDNGIGSDLYVSSLYGAISGLFIGYTSMPFYITDLKINENSTGVVLGDFEYLSSSINDITVVVSS